MASGSGANVTFTADGAGPYIVSADVDDTVNGLAADGSVSVYVDDGSGTPPGDPGNPPGGPPTSPPVDPGDMTPENIGIVQLPDVIENDNSTQKNPGETVARLTDTWATNLEDANSTYSGFVGIAVASVDDTNGTWQYSTDGTSWTAIPQPDGDQAFLLAASDSIRFAASAHFMGTVTDGIDFYAWNMLALDSNDDPQPAPDELIDTDDDPLASGLSGDSSYASVYVEPVVTLSASGTGQFTVSTDAPVPSDLLVTVATSGAPSSGDGWWTGYYLTSDSQDWTDTSGTIITVDISARSQEATIRANSAPYDSGEMITAVLYAAGSSLAGFRSTDAYTGDLTASVQTWLPAGSSPPSDTFGWGAGWLGLGAAFDDAAVDTDGVSADSIVLSGWNGWYGWTGYSETVNWHTVSGTAASGVDYSDASGSFSWSGSASEGWQQVATISLTHNMNAGAKMFYLVEDWQWSDNLGNSYHGTYVVPVSFNNPTLQIYGDSSGDGLVSSGDDPPSNPSYTSDNPVIIGAMDTPAPGGVPSNPGNASQASNGLTAIQIDSYGGAYASLTLSSTSSTLKAWRDPSETQSIDLTGSGTTFSYPDVPSEIWISDSVGEDTQISAELAMNGSAGYGDEQSGGSGSGSGSGKYDASVKIKSVDIPQPIASIIQDSVIRSDPDQINQVTGQLPKGQIAYIPWDNDDDDNDRKLDFTETTVSALDNDLLPITIALPQGTTWNQYEIRAGDGLRILSKQADGSYARFSGTLDNVNPSGNTVTLYVQAVTGQINRLQTSSIKLVYHQFPGKMTGLVVGQKALKVATFDVAGPRNVPNISTYTYEAPSAGTFPSAFAGTLSASAKNANLVTQNVTWAWVGGAVFGRLHYEIGSYLWAIDVAIVAINIDTTASTMTRADQTKDGPSQYTPNGLPTATVDSTSDWKNNPNAAPGTFPSTPAMTAQLVITGIAGPTRAGAPGEYGVSSIQVGLTQTFTFTAWNYTVNGQARLINGRQNVGPLQGRTALDAIDRVFTPNSTYSQRAPLFLFPNGPTLPWYDSTGMTGRSVFQSQANAGVNQIVLTMSDTPMANGQPNAPLGTSALALIDTFTINLVVATTDPAANPRGSRLDVNNNVYTIEASAGWTFNGSLGTNQAGILAPAAGFGVAVISPMSPWSVVTTASRLSPFLLPPGGAAAPWPLIANEVLP